MSSAFSRFRAFVIRCVGVKIGRFQPFAFLFQSGFRIFGPRRIITTRGIPLFLNLRDLAVSGELALKKTWEEGASRVIERILSPGSVFVDVGANIGYFTALAAHRVAPRGQVYAFEPDPENHAILVRNACMAPGTSPIIERRALSARTGSAFLRLDPFNRGHHHIVDFGEGVDTISVPTVSFDGYFADIPGRIDLVKIDVEGAEADVISGMRSSISSDKIRALIVEYHPEAFLARGIDLAGFLVERLPGFSLFRIDDASGCISSVGVADLRLTPPIGAFFNILCLSDPADVAALS